MTAFDTVGSVPIGVIIIDDVSLTNDARREWDVQHLTVSD